MDSKGAKSLS
jgi:superkiller protein 3